MAAGGRSLGNIGTMAFAIVLTWTAVALAAFAWNVYQEKGQTLTLVRSVAQANFDKDQAFRFWAARHGGVYVPQNERTPPNPYLSHILERDIETPGGKKLTLMNPAYMLRQVMEEYGELFGVRGRITSLKPLRKENLPDPWEAKALESFENGAKEASGVSPIEGAPYFRLMQPMTVKQSCLKCHGVQGYKVGDIRGGVSISVPMKSFKDIERRMIAMTGASCGLVWLVGLAIVAFGYRRVRRHMEEQARTEQELTRSRDDLARRVEERTAELQLDIRRREEIEASLRESEERYRHITQSASDGIITIDEDGDIAFCNEAASRMFGYDASEMIGTSMSPLLPERYRDAHEKGLRRLRDGGEPTIIGQVLRLEGLRKDGTEFPLELTLGEWTSGGERFYSGIVRDVSQRLRDEQARLESEAKFRAIADSALDAVVMIDDEGKVTFWNKAAEKIFGWTRDEMLGRKVHDLVMPERYREQMERNFPVFARTGQGPVVGSTAELTAKRSDGDEIPVEISVSAVELDGHWSAVGILRDITNRIETEKRLRQSERIDALSFLMAGVAHEFNNLLFPIITLTDKTLKDLEGNGREKIRLEKVLEAGERMKDLVDHVTTFSRQDEMRRRPVNARSFMNEAQALLRSTLPREIEIESEIDDGLETLIIDPDQMKTVLLNLGNNAADALEGAAGTLSLSLEAGDEEKTLDDEQWASAARFAKLVVRDDGPGMDEAVLKHVFDPFFTTKQVGSGTGLGLATVYGIVAAHGGVITVSSKSGAGTRFSIYLPQDD